MATLSAHSAAMGPRVKDHQGCPCEFLVRNASEGHPAVALVMNGTLALHPLRDCEQENTERLSAPVNEMRQENDVQNKFKLLRRGAQ